MASLAEPEVRTPATAAVGRGPVSRWLLPSFFDLLFLSIPAWLFFSGGASFSRLLLDGDTGWHIRTGEWILEHGRVPRLDLFSFSRAGDPWFAWEWLADVGFGFLMQAGGLKAVVWWSAVLFTVFAGLLMRQMIWRGGHLFIVLPLILLGAGVSTMHLLARPHLYTLLFLPALLWAVQSDLRRPSRRLWVFIPLTALWTNLHGGWLGGIASLGVLAAGLAVEAWMGERDWSAARRVGLLAAGCFAASFVNPYGWQLHAHTLAYVNNDWIKDRVQEFQSPTFRGELMMQFEVLLFAGLIAAGLAMRRRRVAEPLLVLFWAHQSLVSSRHALLYVIVLLPMLAEQLTALWHSWAGRAAKGSIPRILNSIAADSQPAFRRISVWPVAAMLLVLLPSVPALWPSAFPEERFPVKLVEEYRDLFVTKRTLTTDEWGDYLIFANYPDQRVFFDGRSDFYGRELGEEFLRMMQGSYQWRQLLDQHRIEAAILPPGVALASLLKQSSDWQMVRDAGRAVIFERRPGSGKRAIPALMKNPRPAE